MLRVFVVDDSTFTRKALKRVLGLSTEVIVVGEAQNGAEALAKIPAAKPDMITLDQNMPGMDGLATLKELRSRYPDLPVIMLSAHTREGAKVTLDALALGAVDFIDKTSFDMTDLDQLSHQLLEKMTEWVRNKPKPRSTTKPVVPLAARTRTTGLQKAVEKFEKSKSSPSNPANPFVQVKPPSDPPRLPPPIKVDWRRYSVCVLGASTGGPPAIEAILASIPAGFPVPIVIVQHMPVGFTRPFAERLDGVSAISVDEAVPHDLLGPGRAVIGPAGVHMRVGADLTLTLGGEPLDHAHIPSCDVLFKSAAETHGRKCIGILLTGMGDDGADGMVAIRRAGGMTLAQDEASSVVYGMPRAAFQRNGVSHVLSLEHLCAVFAAHT